MVVIPVPIVTSSVQSLWLALPLPLSWHWVPHSSELSATFSVKNMLTLCYFNWCFPDDCRAFHVSVSIRTSPIKWLFLSVDCFSVGLPELILSIDGSYLCSIFRNHLSDRCFKGFSWSILYFLTLLVVFC